MKIIILKNKISKYTAEMLDEKVKKKLKINEKLIDIFI